MKKMTYKRVFSNIGFCRFFGENLQNTLILTKKYLEIFSETTDPVWSYPILTVLFRAFKDFLIIWLSSLVTISMPDGGYSRNASWALNYLYVFIKEMCLIVKEIVCFKMLKTS